jgi:hypothetical protein
MKIERRLAEQFALEHVLSGDIPEDKSFSEIIAALNAGENEEYGACELYGNCFFDDDLSDFIVSMADDIEELICKAIKIKNEEPTHERK